MLFFFGRRVNAFASLGRVGEDRTPPRATVRFPRTLSVRRLIARGLPLTVDSAEGGQVFASIRLGDRPVGFGIANRDTPGVFNLRNSFFFRAAERAVLRRAVGRRVRVLVGVSDGKRNSRRFERTARLTR